MSTDANEAPSEPFLALCRSHAGPGGTLSFAEFMRLALYDPTCGYYRRPGNPIGYGPGTDFFTASTSGPVFGELIVAACRTLLGPAELTAHTFVEVGAQHGASVLTGVDHPFAAVRTVSIGEPLELGGRCIVFSNELFDAQPFRRFTHRDGRWRELGVAVDGPALSEIEIAAPLPGILPAGAPEGYVIDAPLAAAELAEQIAAGPWTGLFLAFDYGKSWAELSAHCPAGTARAYHRHVQSNALLAHPGAQDLTCHICWDWLESALLRHGFDAPALESQEAFFIRHATDFIARVSTSEAGRFSRNKLSLLQLLHPGQLGQKFQVLHARRPALPKRSARA